MESITPTRTTKQAVQPKQKSFIARNYVKLLVLLVLIFAGTSIFFYKKSMHNPSAKAQAEVESLVEKVGRLVVLPTDETPTVATVSDPEVLKEQTFFADAKKGDKVLIYSNARKAILYDHVQNKVITIAPLTLGEDKKSKPVLQPSPLSDTKKEAQ